MVKSDAYYNKAKCHEFEELTGGLIKDWICGITDNYVSNESNITLQKEVYTCIVGELHVLNESDNE